jgi:hypothetical protein
MQTISVQYMKAPNPSLLEALGALEKAPHSSEEVIID